MAEQEQIFDSRLGALEQELRIISGQLHNEIKALNLRLDVVHRHLAQLREKDGCKQ